MQRNIEATNFISKLANLMSKMSQVNFQNCSFKEMSNYSQIYKRGDISQPILTQPSDKASSSQIWAHRGVWSSGETGSGKHEPGLWTEGGSRELLESCVHQEASRGLQFWSPKKTLVRKPCFYFSRPTEEFALLRSLVESQTVLCGFLTVARDIHKAASEHGILLCLRNN